MTSAKAWYFLGLGVVALSFMSSPTARSAMGHASAYVSCARSWMMPYVGGVETALGRTQSGYVHLQASLDREQARAEAVQARLEAQQARIEAAQARLQDQRVQQGLQRAQQVLRNRELMQRVFVADRLAVAAPRVEVRTAMQHFVVCPRTRVHVAVPAVNVDIAGLTQPI